jgi:hypothetical protein
MIPLWNGKNPIYFGVITIILFDNLYRQAYFVMHTFLVHFYYQLWYDGKTAGNMNWKGNECFPAPSLSPCPSAR